MTSQQTVPRNGAIRMDKNVLMVSLTLITVVFGVGGTWANTSYRVNAQEEKLKNVEIRSQENREAMIEIKTKVENVGNKVDKVAIQQVKTDDKVDKIQESVQKILFKMEEAD